MIYLCLYDEKMKKSLLPTLPLHDMQLHPVYRAMISLLYLFFQSIAPKILHAVPDDFSDDA